MYHSHLIASNDHEDLQEQLNDWLTKENPTRIQHIAFVADGNLYTYTILILYLTQTR